jgi:hypothetical protein
VKKLFRTKTSQPILTKSSEPATGNAEVHELELGKLWARLERLEKRRRVWSDSAEASANTDAELVKLLDVTESWGRFDESIMWKIYLSYTTYSLAQCFSRRFLCSHKIT